MASDEETVYCLCRKPYDENEFMIECDICKDWFHGSCVGVQEYQATDIEIYHCPNCQLAHGPLVLKKRRNWHRHDYSEHDDSGKAVQTGTVVFIKELKNRTFPSADEIPIARLHGSELNIEYFRKHGFSAPMVVEKKDGLGLVVPPAQFTIQDVENYVGSMREVDVIDVAKQEDYKMLMREWTEYYNSPNRHKVYNVISLEFSNTKLSEFVSPPSIVRELSWVSNYFPEQLPEDCTYTRPEVQKYCLMGVRDSFTDFHVDFGGTSVWYHILRGEKVFYLVRPTQANLSLYETWVSSANQSETFFGDQVDVCYKCVIKQGQTLFIPTGWIHAVFTPIDSLVFGGNFLHDFNISLQLQVYDIEKRIKTPSKYLFPSFETTHWYAAKHVLDTIKDYTEEGRRPPEYLLSGAKSLTMHLKSWTQRKDFLKDAKHDVPEHLNYGRLLKDLQKEIRAFDKEIRTSDSDLQRELLSFQTSPKVSPVKLRAKGNKLKVEKVRGDRKKKKKNLPTKKQMKNIDLLHQHTTEALQAMEEEQKQSYSNTDDDSNSTSLKVRIPKAGAYLDSSLKKERFVKLDPDIKQEVEDQGTGLKLKVSKGKIISDGKEKLGHSSHPRRKGENEENDSDSDNLVVDENPRKNKRPMGSPSSASTMKPGSLKLKLSFAGKALPSDLSSGQGSTQESETATSQSEAEDAGGIPRANLPTIQGGLNCSISDILEASGYGTETDFIVDNERTSSPSMRDAIQGMLSMSRMGDDRQQLFRNKRSAAAQRLQQRNQMIMEEEAKLEQCYKDEEFIYPGLDLSDDEMEQTRDNKRSRDDNWNPKARVQVSGVKGERPHREGVKKEAVEQVLAAAAAKPAPSKPKKPRKRLKSESFSESDPSSVPGTALSSSAPGSAFRPNLVKPAKPQGEMSSPVKAKKPKKGLATAKQRLGKILKINKLGMF
ncbi:lysine-specific demethylase 7B-like isoform X2 [Crassostrea angulata]|uniref:lysine-specific demethylase 7B-like isoform X2 n=1 Tax=Magallana angulata TaxID=2784310 RepID=UPI0022B154D8|nr:lysine-specific demethylase 7B-like isoform X2 [Crassostrea angulata]